MKQQLLDKFYSTLSELYRLECIGALLNWDQQVYMPPKASQARAEQIELIELQYHQKLTDYKYFDIVQELAASNSELATDDQVNVKEIKRVLDRQVKLPDDFISEKAKAHSLGYDTWVKARPENDFEAVKPYLEKIVDLARRECDLVGFKGHPYNALFDIYEPGGKIEQTKPLLTSLAEQLRKIIPAITDKFANIKDLDGDYDPILQKKLCVEIAQCLGYNLERGRIDATAHPFMTTIGPSDQRITTRFDKKDFISSLYSTIHETGHALYEMGLPEKWAGTPRASAVSMGIHESQSRLWENIVGRSKQFAIFLHSKTAQIFPDVAKELSSDDMWLIINKVKPSLIRTEADEVTYSQHVVIRLILEEQLIKGSLQVSDLPSAWNELYEQYLGLRPTDYKNGVMQDVHWYSGAIGYFPTYALGNLYNAMMFEKAQTDMPEVYDQIENGEFLPLLKWLGDNVHQYGKTYSGPELIKKITGKDLQTEPFVNYLKKKLLQE